MLTRGLFFFFLPKTFLEDVLSYRRVASATASASDKLPHPLSQTFVFVVFPYCTAGLQRAIAKLRTRSVENIISLSGWYREASAALFVYGLSWLR